MGNILGGISSERADAERYERDNRLNPAEYAPGQEVSEMDEFDDFGGFDDGFGGGGFDDFGGGGDDFGFGGGMDDFSNFSVPQDNMMNPTGNFGAQPQQGAKSQEDMIFDATVSIAKGTGNAIKDLTNSASGIDAIFLSEYGGFSTVLSMGVGACGLACWLLGKPAGVQLLVGGLLGAATGVLLTAFNNERANQLRGNTEYMENRVVGVQEENTENVQPEAQPVMADDFGENVGGDDWAFADADSSGGDEWDWGDEGSSDGDDWGDDAWDIPIDTPEPEPEPEQNTAVDMSSAMGQLEHLDKGLYTREYLYNLFMSVLENATPDYAEFKEIDKDSDLFIGYSAALRDSATVLGTKEDAMPELLSVKESRRVVVLECTRPRNMKHDAIAEEMATQYAYDGNGSIDEGVYAQAKVVGVKCIITIFKPDKFLVTYKDLMNDPEVKKFVLDTGNYIPVVFGIDQIGKPIMEDLKHMESMLVQGQARVGKSWFVQFVLTQMCAYLSPKELNFYICDAKDGISDYRSFGLPHVKKFLTKDEDMVNILRWLAREEGPRRENIIGKQAGEVNIWDYKKKYPDVDIPLIYVVVDEAAALAQRMDKEVKNEFQSLLLELITKTPALGIRIILIPHLVKDDIIKKSVTDMVKCKISIASDADMIKAVTGAAKKDFQFDINNKQGELAYKHTTKIPVYVKAGVLSNENNKNTQIFEYLRRVWKKLEPDTVSEVSQSVEERNTVAEFEREIKDNNMENQEVDMNSMFTTEELLNTDEDNFNNEVSFRNEPVEDTQQAETVQVQQLSSDNLGTQSADNGFGDDWGTPGVDDGWGDSDWDTSSDEGWGDEDWSVPGFGEDTSNNSTAGATETQQGSGDDDFFEFF